MADETPAAPEPEPVVMTLEELESLLAKVEKYLPQLEMLAAIVAAFERRGDILGKLRAVAARLRKSSPQGP